MGGTKPSHSQQRKAVWLAINGDNPLEYLEKCGCQTPATHWAKILTQLQKTNPERYDRIPEKYKETCKEQNKPVTPVKQSPAPAIPAAAPEKVPEQKKSEEPAGGLEPMSLREVRLKHNMLLKELSKAAGIDISTLSKIETRKESYADNLPELYIERLKKVFSEQEIKAILLTYNELPAAPAPAAKSPAKPVKNQSAKAKKKLKAGSSGKISYPGERVLKMLRKDKNLRLLELCSLTGLSRATVDRLENFRDFYSMPTDPLKKLAKVFSKEEIACIRDSFQKYINWLKTEACSEPACDSVKAVEDGQKTNAAPDVETKPAENPDKEEANMTENPVESTTAEVTTPATTLKGLRLQHNLTLKELGNIMETSTKCAWMMESKSPLDLTPNDLGMLKKAFSEEELQVIIDAALAEFDGSTNAVKSADPVTPQAPKEEQVTSDPAEENTILQTLLSAFKGLSAKDQERLSRIAVFMVYNAHELKLPAVSKRKLSADSQEFLGNLEGFMHYIEAGMILPMIPFD